MMNLEELILRLEHLATLVDDPADVRVFINRDLSIQKHNIKFVELLDFDVYIVV